MDQRITQCPRCGTSFRVTEAHLAVAAGAVRCGSCLHIFNAREHWVAETPSPVIVEKPEARRALDDIEIDDDALFDDDTPLFADDAEDDQPTPPPTGSRNIFNPVDDDFEVIDDGRPEEFSDTFLEINSWEEDTGASFQKELHEEEADNHVDEEAWAQKLLAADDDPLAAAANAAPPRADIFDDYSDLLDNVPEIDETEEQTPRDNLSAEFSAEFLDLDADPVATRPASSTPPGVTFDHTLDGEEIALEPMRAEPGDRSRALFGLNTLEVEPLQLHQFVHEPRWPKVLWGVGLVLAIALGVGQYIYFNFHSLAHGPLRPWLERGCQWVQCVLPPQVDTNLIRSNSLIVRSHPTQRGALAVDAIITNQADFPQPYPQLQLQFTDLNGAPVAGRQFRPDEYLSGELRGSRLMPVQQPVHIALELLDPGPRAVNYLLSVVPAAAP